MSKDVGADLALSSKDSNIKTNVDMVTNGTGPDATIITAGTSSLEPINLAGSLCRHKGKVVVVGAVPTGFDREHYFKKELEVRMSTSYGPGRYDSQYEDKGLDYPIGYVRWTENRNMQAFIELLIQKKLNIETLITHTFDFKDAVQAYQMILDKKEPFVGILLRYDSTREVKTSVKLKEETQSQSPLNIGFIGAGSFAQNFLLPVVGKHAEMIGVATARSNNARHIADKYQFNYCTGNADEVIADENIGTVFIATRHNLHAEYVIKALKANKNVFVEKPLALTKDDFEKIQSFYSNPSSSEVPKLMVGFNRRFALHIQKVKELFDSDTPKAINYRINSGSIPLDHWVHDPEVGGGRIIGEVCHFIDLTQFITGSKITSVSATALNTPENLSDTLAINLSFENGSVASISYFSNGAKILAKEYLEIFDSGSVVIIDDFKQMTVFQGEKKNVMKLKKQDKGHEQEVVGFLEALKNGQPTPIPLEETFATTSATFKVIDSILSKERITL